jgi:hypothetical protein
MEGTPYSTNRRVGCGLKTKRSRGEWVPIGAGAALTRWRYAAYRKRKRREEYFTLLLILLCLPIALLSHLACVAS